METEKGHIKNLKFYKGILENRYLSYIIVPTVIFSSSLLATKIIKTPTMEYQAITRTVDASSGEILSEIKTFEDTPTEHILTVLEYSPWQKYSEDDYRRTVVEYNHDLDSSEIKKEEYTEQKESISEEDNNKEKTVIVKQTILDKTKKRIRKDYWIPLVTSGTILSIIVNYLLHNDISKDFQGEDELEEYEKVLTFDK